MYYSEHSNFILSPLTDILKDGISACRGVNDGMESYPLCEYVMQSLFLKLTGAQEQKMKCICWDIATLDYEYRYDFMNKNYGEYSNWKSKNGVFRDLLTTIRKKDPKFEPSLLIDNDFLSYFHKRLQTLFEDSILIKWQYKQYALFKEKHTEILRINQICQPTSNNSKDYTLFQTSLQNLFEEIVYNYRNCCAHNTLSFQQNKPDFSILAESNYMFRNYFFRYSIIFLIDNIYITLFKKYLSLQPERN